MLDSVLGMIKQEVKAWKPSDFGQAVKK